MLIRRTSGLTSARLAENTCRDILVENIRKDIIEVFEKRGIGVTTVTVALRRNKLNLRVCMDENECDLSVI